jgi:hypothetical protein
VAPAHVRLFFFLLDLLIRRYAFSVGEMSINYETYVVTSSTFEICQLSLLKILIGVGVRVYIHKDECTCFRYLHLTM